jgi:hypothetical protein
MNRRQMMAATAATAFSSSFIVPGSAMSATPKPVPPVARKIPKRIEQLGRVRVDDYAWMKDDNWQKVLRDPTLIKADVKEHLTAENAYTKAMLAPTETLQTAMFEEMKGRIKEDDASVPDADGAWEYYSRYEKGAQHPIHARRPVGKTSGEVILLDEEAEAKGKAFYQVGAASHTADHRYYGWAVDEQGSCVSSSARSPPANRSENRSRTSTTSSSRRTASGSSGPCATRTADRRRFTVARSAGPRRTTCWSMTSRTRASSSAPGFRSPASGSSSAAATRTAARPG